MQSLTKTPLLLVNFGLREIYSYAAKLSQKVGTQFNLFHEQSKALSLVQEKFVYNIRFLQDNDVLRIEARVKAEMRTKVSYEVCIDIMSDNEVRNCSCSCPAGASPGSCKHVFAVLHCLEEYSRLELYSAPTERLQAWHQPKKVKLSPKKSTTLFIKPTFNKAVKKVNFSALFTGGYQNLQNVSVFSDYAAESVKHMPPLPACVVAHNPLTVLDQLTTGPAQFVKEKLLFNLDAIWKLEQETIAQSESLKWREERQWRLTASKFYDVCVRRGDFEKLADSILSSHSQDLSGIPAIAHGLKFESLVRTQIRSVYPDMLLRKVGLVSNPFWPHLAASPDGLLHKAENTMLLEVKCSFNPRRLELEELASKSSFCLTQTDGKWHLKRTHKYYYQIQGQLALTNLEECVFALFYRSPNYLHTEVILFDSDCWSSMQSKLDDFYVDYYLPALLKNSRIPNV